jgi:hypothetical protein
VRRDELEQEQGVVEQEEAGLHAAREWWRGTGGVTYSAWKPSDDQGRW